MSLARWDERWVMVPGIGALEWVGSEGGVVELSGELDFR